MDITIDGYNQHPNFKKKVTVIERSRDVTPRSKYDKSKGHPSSPCASNLVQERKEGRREGGREGGWIVLVRPACAILCGETLQLLNRYPREHRAGDITKLEAWMLDLRDEMKCDISIICEKVMSVIRIRIVVCLTTWTLSRT